MERKPPIQNTWSWQSNTKDDMPDPVQRYGQDLLVVVPEDWLNLEKARGFLSASNVHLPCQDGSTRVWQAEKDGQVHLLWFFSGCANATAAFLERSTGRIGVAGPPVDVSRPRWNGLPKWDVLLPSVRRWLWAMMVVWEPKWVHTAPPCTFWSTLSRRCNKRTPIEDERLRLQATALLFFVRATLCVSDAAQTVLQFRTTSAGGELENGHHHGDVDAGHWRRCYGFERLWF